MAKYLDDSGVSQLWTAVKEQDATNLAAAKNYADGKDNAMGTRVSALEGYFTSGVANEAAKATKDGSNNNIEATYVKKTQLGASTPSGANPAYTGVATLDTNGKVPASQLPSFVDDVVEGYYHNAKFYQESAHTTEISGEGGKIYVDLTTLNTYRWSGSAWVMISESLAVGTTAGTAYDGAAGAQLASDVSDLQTAVTTTIPATYVPLNSSNSKGHFKNNPTYVQMSFEDGTNGASGINLTDTITLTAGNSSNISEIALLKTSIEIVAPNLKWKTSSSATAKTIATTDDITITSFKVDGTAVSPSSKAVEIKTINGNYNDSTNKLATASDISPLQTAVETTIPATYVPISSGTNKGVITNDSTNIKITYGNTASTHTEIIQTDTYCSVSYKSNSSTIERGITVSANSGVTVTGSSFKWGGKTVATTDQIPAVEAITSQELAAILA